MTVAADLAQVQDTRRSGEPVYRIVVAVHGDDPLSRAGLVGLLEKRHNVIVPDGGDSAMAGYTRGVAVVLAERMDAAELVRLRKLVITMEKRVVLVTGELGEEQIELALDAGVQSVLWRHQVTAERLAKAVEAAWRGEGDVPPDLLTRLLAQLRRVRRRTGPALGSAPEPSPRELTVLRLIADGLDTKEIAEQLSYSERTVKAVLHDLMTRRQLRNRAHAVAFAVREGYI